MIKKIYFKSNFLKIKIFLKIFIIFILFVINLYLVFAQSFGYTKFSSHNQGFILRFPTDWGNYNFEISKTSVGGYSIIPSIRFYSTNTTNNLNKHLFLIRSFYGRSLIYSHKVDENKSIIVDLSPPRSGNITGSINFYHYVPASGGGYYHYYSKIYGNIEDLIDVYTCEDGEWRRNQTCLGRSGNPSYCFGNSPGFGKVIHEGLLMGLINGAEAGLTICVRTNY